MALIYVRPANQRDIPSILEIIKSAKQFLKAQKIDQWQNNYPNQQSIKNDVDNKANYVLIDNHQIAGTASLIPGIDKSYLHINDGSWINGPRGKYLTIHRVAISNQFRGEGLSRLLMSNLISLAVSQGFRDLRIDTHPDNQGMQHVITANGFQKRGIIHTLEGGKQTSTARYAYQLIIKDDYNAVR